PVMNATLSWTPSIGTAPVETNCSGLTRSATTLLQSPPAALGAIENMVRARASAVRRKVQAPAASEITHTRFLMSAERLFCVHGYEGTKIRAIATLSNANLGMLSHYWGSKRALFREVFERRLRPIHEERMRRFRLIERAHKAGRPVSLVDVLKAQ